MQKNTGENNTDFTLISAYIDNECSTAEEIAVKNLIETDDEFRNIYEFEKAFTAGFRRCVKSVTTPEETVNKIMEIIEAETLKRKQSLKRNTISKFKLFNYLFPAAAVLLVFLAYYIFTSINKAQMDFVNESRNLFGKIEKNEIPLQHLTSDAVELQKLLSASAGYNVFVPQLKDAELLGGTVNEMNSANVVHFVHRNNGKIIYTMQMSRSDLIEKDKLSLNNYHYKEICDGHNWIECERKNTDCTVIWFKNDVICSSVSKFEAREIATLLTNYK